MIDSTTAEKEIHNVISRTLNPQELIDIIYKGQSSPQDSRFSPIEDGGVFKYFSLQDLMSPFRGTTFYPAVEQDGKIVGISELEIKPKTTDTAWIKFLSVDPASRGMGHGTRLAEEIFRFAKEKSFSLEQSSYSREGYEKLKPIFNRLAQSYHVPFTDTDRIKI